MSSKSALDNRERSVTLGKTGGMRRLHRVAHDARMGMGMGMGHYNSEAVVTAYAYEATYASIALSAMQPWTEQKRVCLLLHNAGIATMCFLWYLYKRGTTVLGRRAAREETMCKKTEIGEWSHIGLLIVAATSVVTITGCYYVFQALVG